MGFCGVGEEKVERRAALREIAQVEALDGIEKLGVEVVDPELVEVAEDDEWGPAGDDVSPILEGLVVVLFEVRTARFHLDEHTLGPEEVGELLAALRFHRRLSFDEFELGGTGFLGDAKLQRRACLLHAAVAEGAEEVVEEKLRLTFFVAFQRTGEGGECHEGGLEFSRSHGAETAERDGR